MMAKLTDTQLIVLSKAAQRDDGAATLPSTLGRAPAAKVAASLIKRKLMRQIRSKEGMPVWHTDDAGRSFSLVILRAGRDAIGIEDGVEQNSETQNAARSVAPHEKLPQGDSNEPPRRLLQGAAIAPREGSKISIVIAMLSRSEGATIDQLMTATQWLPHTTRAVLTGLRKKGYALDRQRQDGVTRYRIVGTTEIAKAA